MKRSEINAAIRRAMELLRENRWSLPPWAHWTAEDYAGNAATAGYLRDHQMGWDVTDFGSGDFARRGLTLFCVRNGVQSESKGKPYAEKLLIVAEGQETPTHRHRVKMEDIINRAGGVARPRIRPRGQRREGDRGAGDGAGRRRRAHPSAVGEAAARARRERHHRARNLSPLLRRGGKGTSCWSARSARSTTTRPTITFSSRSGASPKSRRTNRRCAACGTRSPPEGGSRSSIRIARLPSQTAAPGAGASGEEKSCATLRPLPDFVGSGRIALSEHGRALGLEDHHAPQHADRFGGVVDTEKAAGAQSAQPVLHRLARAPDRILVERGADLGKCPAFADDEAGERDGPRFERQRPVDCQHPFQRRPGLERIERRQIDVEDEPPDAVRDHAGEKIGLGRNQPIERLGRNARARSYRGNGRGFIALRLELLRGGLDDQRARVLVTSHLRPAATALGRLDPVNFDHHRFPNSS